MEARSGGEGIAMNFVVLPNGLVQRGRPLSRAPVGVEGHSEYSVYVGLVRNKNAVATAKQVSAVNSVARAFYSAIPGGQMFGAEEIDERFPKVGIDIDKLVTSNGRQNFGVTDQSYSTTQLIEAAQMTAEASFDPATVDLPSGAR